MIRIKIAIIAFQTKRLLQKVKKTKVHDVDVYKFCGGQGGCYTED